MATLQERAQAFLNRPIPAELAKKYVPGSLSELFIGSYADEGTLDAESAELIGICALESDAAAERYKTLEAKEYFSECASILVAIGAEQPAI